MDLAPRVALCSADAYVSGCTTLALPALGHWHPGTALGTNVVESAGRFHTALPVINGVMAGGHVILGLVYLCSDTDYKKESAAYKALKVAGIGELVTAVGMAGQAAGLGLWALPVTLLGMVTATVGDTIQKNGGQS
jgi:hypothetical protein